MQPFGNTCSFNITLHHTQSSVSQTVIQRPAVSVSLGNLLEMLISGPAADPVNQKLWEHGPGMLFNKLPGDSDAH